MQIIATKSPIGPPNGGFARESPQNALMFDSKPKSSMSRLMWKTSKLRSGIQERTLRANFHRKKKLEKKWIKIRVNISRVLFCDLSKMLVVGFLNTCFLSIARIP